MNNLIKFSYEASINIAAAALLTIIYESLRTLTNHRKNANAILNLNAFIQNYIVSFSKLLLEMTYEEKKVCKSLQF